MSDEQQMMDEEQTEEVQPMENVTQGSAENAPLKKPFYKHWWFWAIIVLAAVVLIVYIVDTGGLNAGNGIKIEKEELITNQLETIVGNNMFPIVAITVTNTSSTVKKVSFEANFYANGELLGDGQASYVTLAPGDKATLKAQCERGYRFGVQKEYTYKITKWWVFDP